MFRTSRVPELYPTVCVIEESHSIRIRLSRVIFHLEFFGRSDAETAVVYVSPVEGKSRQLTQGSTQVWRSQRYLTDSPEHFSVSLMYGPAWPFCWAKVHRKETIINYRLKLAIQRVVCFVCACWLVNRSCHSNHGDTLVYTVTKYESMANLICKQICTSGTKCLWSTLFTL